MLVRVSYCPRLKMGMGLVGKLVVRPIIGLGAMISIVVMLILFCPVIYLWRWVAVKISRIRGYEKILSPTDIFPYEESTEERGAPRCALVTAAVLEGDMEVEEVRKSFEERVLKRKGPSGYYRYPELKMKEKKLLGFRFMTFYEDFRIEEHIVEGGAVGSLREIHEILMNRRFTSGRSPWELVVYRKALEGKVVLGFRIHHSIADGLSALKMFVECMGGKELVKARAQEVKRSLVQSLGYRLKLPISLGNDGVDLWIDTFRTFRRGRVLQRQGKEVNRNVVVGLSERISMEEVKTTGKSFGVTTSACIMAGVLGALENFMRKEYGSLKEQDICLGYVLPLEGHPEGLANHWTSTYTTVRYGDKFTKSTRERLKGFNRAFLEMKSGTRRTFLKYSVVYSGACVVPLAKALLKNRVCSIGMTNIAGEDEGFQVEGRDCVEFSLTSGGLHGIDLIFCIMSYKGHFRVGCVTEKNVMNESSVTFLAECISSEFNCLREASLQFKMGSEFFNPLPKSFV